MKNRVDCLTCELHGNAYYKKIETASWDIITSKDTNHGKLFFIKTKRHVSNISDLTIQEAHELGYLLKKYSGKSTHNGNQVLNLSLKIKNPHVHFWIIPEESTNGNYIREISLTVKKLVQNYEN